MTFPARLSRSSREELRDHVAGRPTWLPSARCSFIRLIISAISSGEMSLAAWEMTR